MFDLSNRLAARLAVLMTLALAPLGVIAIYSEYQTWRAQAQAEDDALVARTLDTVAGPRGVLESAMASLDRLAPLVLDRAGDPAACASLLSDFIDASGLYAHVAFHETSVTPLCSSDERLGTATRPEVIAAQFETPGRVFVLQDSDATTGEPGVVAIYPVRTNGSLDGVLTLLVSRHTIGLFKIGTPAREVSRSTFVINGAGEVLVGADHADADDLLPGGDALAGFISAGNGVFNAASTIGAARMFTIAEATPGQLYALGSWESGARGAGRGFSVWRVAFPVLMWMASLGVVMLAINYMVVRHLRQINTQLRRFALGNRDEFQRLPPEAASELREIDSTFTKMARLIRRDEQQREEALEEKTVLLREVHHRVKNNLQLIASILNLQRRRLADADARGILQGVQARVRSLASIHRALYQQDRFGEKYAAGFFEGILSDTLAIARHEVANMDVQSHFDDVNISQDKIIPAALLFSEAITNAMKYATAQTPGDRPRIAVSLTAHGGQIELTVWNSLAGSPEDNGGDGLGQELITAFALQINGEVDIGPTQDSRGNGWELGLRFASDSATAPEAA